MIKPDLKMNTLYLTRFACFSKISHFNSVAPYKVNGIEGCVEVTNRVMFE